MRAGSRHAVGGSGPATRSASTAASTCTDAPNTACRNHIVEPAVRPAADIIDWDLVGTRIGDRTRPLADKTMARIRAGIERYWAPIAVPVEGRGGKQARPTSEPLRTATARNETGLAFIAELRGGGSKHRPVTDPLATVTASGNHHGLVTSFYGATRSAQPTDSPLPSVTTVEKMGLITRHFGSAPGQEATFTTPTDEPLRTITTRGNQSLMTGASIDVDDVYFRMLEPREYKRAMDFPSDYLLKGNRREQVRQAGGAVTPPVSRDLVGVTVEGMAS